jgi:hypothetical protein
MVVQSTERWLSYCLDGRRKDGCSFTGCKVADFLTWAGRWLYACIHGWTGAGFFGEWVEGWAVVSFLLLGLDALYLSAVVSTPIADCDRLRTVYTVRRRGLLERLTYAAKAGSVASISGSDWVVVRIYIQPTIELSDAGADKVGQSITCPSKAKHHPTLHSHCACLWTHPAHGTETKLERYPAPQHWKSCDISLSPAPLSRAGRKF